jgi:RNA polymerase-binding transcription factor DksA
MKSAWQEFKEKVGDAKPWHLLNQSNYAEDSVSSYRYQICSSCDELINLTKQCKKCGCVMTMKTKLQVASCPLGKW